MFYLGTSGFNYTEWIGRFYPQGQKRTTMLAYYASIFNSVEINYTFQRLPSPKALAQWAAQVGDDFRFSYKAPRQITHFSRLKNSAEPLARFYEALDSSSLNGAILFQLPPTLRKDSGLLEAFVAELDPQRRHAFEFRDASWFDDQVFEILARANVALCIADSPDLSTPPEVTADFGYLRLRNENYQPDDITRWARVSAELAPRWHDLYTYFKHEDTATGPRFAQAYREQLEALGVWSNAEAPFEAATHRRGAFKGDLLRH